MLFKKKKFPKLTSREVDIMNILWTSGKPLIASEIADCRPDLTINTVQAVLRKLLNTSWSKLQILYTAVRFYPVRTARRLPLKNLLFMR